MRAAAFAFALIAVLVPACLHIATADDATAKEIAYARATACIAITKITGTPLPECHASECKVAEQKATDILTKVLAEKKAPQPLPQGPLFLEGGRLMVEDGKVWQRNANGTYTLSACRYENGQVVCPLKQK